MKNIARQSWDIIPMPGTFINQVDLLRKYQQELLVFTDSKGQIIGDGDVELAGVDKDGDENKAPPKIENENDLDYQKDQE